MAKWEYAVIWLKADKSQQDALNKCGSEGWELVSVIEVKKEFMAYFKRERK